MRSRRLLATLAVYALLLQADPAAAVIPIDRLVFHPQPPIRGLPRSRPGLEEVSIATADGTRLSGCFAAGQSPAGPAPLLIYFGGNAEEVSWMCDVAPRLAGWSLLAVNYRGYGRSQGTPEERLVLADALAVHAYALARADVDSARVAVMGRSLGSAVATYLAAERPVAGVVLVTPFDSVTDIARRLYPWLPVEWLIGRRFDSISRAPRLHAPLLTLAAARDDVVPVAHAERLHAAWAGEKTWRAFPHAGHNDISDDPRFWSEVQAFLERLRKP